MDTAPVHRIFTGRGQAAPPPLAGALAAWLTSIGLSHRVVDLRGEALDWPGEGGAKLGKTSGRLKNRDGAHCRSPALDPGRSRLLAHHECNSESS